MQNKAKEILKEIQDLHVVVIGDIMIDSYAWGSVDRISPEAAVPIVQLFQRDSRLGGAANAALNCISLGAKVTLASVIGNDEKAKRVLNLCKEEGIFTDLIIQSNERLTTEKTRILSNNQQIMRLDEENHHDLSTKEEHPFIEKVLKFLQIEKPDIVLFEDYNKGVLKENVIEKVINHANRLGIITAVDPKKKNFLSYKNVTIFKPNFKELKEGLGFAGLKHNIENYKKAHKELYAILKHQISLFTLSEHGMYYQNQDEGKWIPAHKRKIKDVSGAGDTVISVAVLWYAITKNMEEAMKVANLAGGLVCEEVGVMPISQDKILNNIHQIK